MLPVVSKNSEYLTQDKRVNDLCGDARLMLKPLAKAPAGIG